MPGMVSWQPLQATCSQAEIRITAHTDHSACDTVRSRL
jgi:hypothetical protein